MYNAQLTKAVTLTPAQIKSLIASPTLLITGRAGQIIKLLSCFIRYQPGTVSFGTIQAGDAITPMLGSSISTALIQNDGEGLTATGFIDQTTNAMGAWLLMPWINPDESPVSPAVLKGASVYLTQFNQNTYPSGTDWTTGNGTLTVFLRYSFIEAL